MVNLNVYSNLNFVGKQIANFTLLLYLIIGSVTYINAQNLYYGRIIDKNTNANLPFVNICIQNKIIGISNYSGQFRLMINKSKNDDTILFTMVGYKAGVVKATEFFINDSNLFFLNPTPFQLNEVVLNSSIKNGKLKNFGSKEKKNFGSIMGRPGFQSALYFANPKRLKGSINKVGYFITEKGNPKTYFRVRLYNVDSQGKPGDDLLRENIIVQGSSQDGNWLDISLANYGIAIPTNGFFVAMEWLPESKDELFEYWSTNMQKDSIKGTYYGQVLGVTDEFKENFYWLRSEKSIWGRHNMPKYLPRTNPKNGKIENIPFLNTFNPMIRAELLIIK